MTRWHPIATAPKDGTWILGMNNRGNCSVVIWSDSALYGDELRSGWIHPFSDGRLSLFWNGACGSQAVAWCRLPSKKRTESILALYAKAVP